MAARRHLPNVQDQRAYGAMCSCKIFGVEILNEGFGISIDDAVSEMQATFVARVVEPMSAVASPYQSAF
jgi:hypothetical protein